MLPIAYLIRPRQPAMNSARWAQSAAVVTWVLVLLAGIAVSLSRSAMLYVALAVLTLALCRRVPRWILGTAVPVALSVILFAPLPTWFFYVFRLGAGLSFRESLWGAGWRMMTENPAFGIGPGKTYEVLRASYIEPSIHRELIYTTGGGAHNVFLNSGATMGWIGLILSVVLFALILSRVPRALKRYRQGDWLQGAGAAAVVGLSVRGLFEAGGTLGLGALNDSLMFFLFALILLIPEPLTPRVIAIPKLGLSTWRSGGERMWNHLADRWRKAGHPIVSEETIPVPPALEANSWMMPIWYALAYRKVARGVLFVDHSGHGRLSLLIRSKRFNPRVRVVTVVHHLRDEFRFRNALYTRLARRHEMSFLRHADRVIVHTRREAERVAAQGVSPRAITVIRVGVDRPRTRHSPRPLTSDRPLSLLWIGGDFERKGMETMLRSLAGCPEPRPRLSVVGRPKRGGEAKWAQRLAEELNLQASVDFMGFVSDEALNELWSEHDVFVQPSRHEGHGSALDEALVRGVPVVASDLDVFRERITDDAVVFVPVDDTAALTAALVALREDAARVRYASAGLKLTQEWPAWADTYDAYSAVLEEELAKV